MEKGKDLCLNCKHLHTAKSQGLVAQAGEDQDIESCIYTTCILSKLGMSGPWNRTIECSHHETKDPIKEEE